MFIPLTGEILFIPGFLTPEEAKEKTEFLIEGKTKQIIKNDCINLISQNEGNSTIQNSDFHKNEPSLCPMLLT